MQIKTSLSQQLERYLDLAVSETKVTASNMANIDTPGFRTKGFDFEAAMRSALGSSARTGGQPGVHVHEIDGLVSRPDGNNVSLDREALHLAEAQLKFRTGAALMRIENQRMMSAIHADR